MALRMGALYDALKQVPGLPEEAAREAAEEVAQYESSMAEIRSSLRLGTWMLSAVIALVLVNLGFTFQILSKLVP
jgi:hypothetical protein